MRKATLSVLAFTAMVAPAHAHPGHGSDGGSMSLVHYLSDPFHAAVGALVVLGIAIGLAVVRRKAARSTLPL